MSLDNFHEDLFAFNSTVSSFRNKQYNFMRLQWNFTHLPPWYIYYFFMLLVIVNILLYTWMVKFMCMAHRFPIFDGLGSLFRGNIYVVCDNMLMIFSYYVSNKWQFSFQAFCWLLSMPIKQSRPVLTKIYIIGNSSHFGT